jgi:hypothetical protein
MLIVELNYSNVITAINEFQPQQSYLGAIAEDRGSFFFLPNFNNLKFFMFAKVANQIADYLAKFAISSCCDFVWT